jgi:hypothetical protein
MTELAHLNHELYQLMLLHSEMRSVRWALYPEVMKRAGAVAYAAHLRSLLEFFHGDRPRQAENKRVGCPASADLTVCDVYNAPPTAWSDDEIRRLCDADKLLAHLSSSRDAMTSDFGRDSDWLLVRAHIDRLLEGTTEDLTEARAARTLLA